MKNDENYYNMLGIRSGKFDTKSVKSALKDGIRYLMFFQRERKLKLDRATDESSEETLKVKSAITKGEKSKEFFDVMIKKLDNAQISGLNDTEVGVIFTILYSIKTDIFESSIQTIKGKYTSKMESSKTVTERLEIERKLKEETERIKEKYRKAHEAYLVLKDTRKRKKYEEDLKEQEYLNSLTSKQLRLVQSERLIKSVFGPDFDPDLSSYDEYSDKEKRGIQGSEFAWKVHLNENRRKILESKVVDKSNPNLDCDISVYEYGSFGFATLYNERTSKYTYTDDTPSLIGVTKTFPDGTKDTNYLITHMSRIDDEDKDFVSKMYFSDYLVNNAVENNGNYLFSFHKNRDGKISLMSGPGELDLMRACFFARNNGGRVNKIGSKGFRIIQHANGLEDVFKEIDLRLKKGFYGEEAHERYGRVGNDSR